MGACWRRGLACEGEESVRLDFAGLRNVAAAVLATRWLRAGAMITYSALRASPPREHSGPT